MSDQNPYRPPSEYDEPIAPTSDGSWPKTATATIDADWYLRALHVDKRREKLFVRVFVVFFMGILALAGLAYLLGSVPLPDTIDGGTCVMIAMVVLGVLYLPFATGGSQPKWTIRKQLREMGREYEEVRYEIAPDQIRFYTKESESRFSWDRFLRWKERDGVILLYVGSKSFLFVPVELFEPDVADALRASLRSHVPG